MKRTPLTRKVGLKRSGFALANKTLKSGEVGAFKGFKRATGPVFTKKRVARQISGKKTPSRRKPTISKLKKKLWELCRDITRLKHGYNCYTCGSHSDAPHTGHFIPSSICSVSLRYDLNNLRPQCYRCNIHLSGNWVAFENRLLSQFGELYVKALKRENEETKGRQYDSLWYENKIQEYEALLSSLQ